MPGRPLHISLRKINIYERHREAETQMEAGSPGPMEETFRILERARKHQEEVERAFRAGYNLGRSDRGG